MEPDDITLALLFADVAGTAVFAISGGLAGVRRDLDVFGVLVLAVVTGLGGGIIRDVLIGETPPVALQRPELLISAIVAGLVVSYLSPEVAKVENFIGFFDALGMGLFCVVGADAALRAGVSPWGAALLGMVTAIGGGVVRDVLTSQVPAILRKRDLYAMPALLGASIAVLARTESWPSPWASIIAAMTATGWRLIAVRRGWQAPLPRVTRDGP